MADSPSISTPPTAARRSLSNSALFGITLTVSLAVSGALLAQRQVEVWRLKKQIAEELAKERKLAAANPQYDEFNRLLRDLENRIDVIQGLQEKRADPTSSMAVLRKAASLSGEVNLTSLDLDNGRLVGRGRSPSLSAAAQFLSTLQNSGSFSDVTLSKFYQDDAQNRANYGFEFDCAYSTPPPAEATPNKKAGNSKE